VWLVSGHSAELTLTSADIQKVESVALQTHQNVAPLAAPVQTLAVYTRDAPASAWVLARVCRADGGEGQLACPIAPREAVGLRLVLGGSSRSESLVVGPLSIESTPVGSRD
jgi:hypothetical protein